MRKTSLLLVIVLILGYSVYGGMYFAAGAIHESLAVENEIPTNDIRSELPSRVTGESGTEPFEFSAVDAGLEYSYVSTGTELVIGVNAGAYVADYNGDNWTDVLLIGGQRPILFENVRGSFEPTGVFSGWSSFIRKWRPGGKQDARTGEIQGAHWLDYNVDGRPDLVLLPKGTPPVLLENTPTGFRIRPSAFDRSLPGPGGAAAGDYNRDGCPDLFVFQKGDWSDRLPLGLKTNFTAPVNGDNGNPDYLYRGSCSGFEPASAGSIRGARWTLAASFVDLTGDGYPDIHETNDYNHDIVYLNQRNGSFRQVVLPERTNRNGMSSEIADVTGSGRLDVFVTNIYYPEIVADRLNPGVKVKARGNNLITRLHGSEFVERADQYNVTSGGWGWAAVIADFDNDGDEDLFHSTKRVHFARRDARFSQQEIEQLRELSYYSHPAVWGRTDRASFRQMDAKAAGFDANNGRGAARLDYDNDGDPDLVVAGSDGYQLYDNRMNGSSAIQVRVLGSNGSQTAAYGASVSVSADGRTQSRRVHARSDFLSQDSRLVHVGVGNATTVDVRVVWPDGLERRFEGLAAGQRIVVTPVGAPRTMPLDGR